VCLVLRATFEGESALADLHEPTMEGAAMDILFIQSGHRRVETIVTRRDGVRLSVPVFGPLEPIPHDLARSLRE
jgi:hypothetical protein